MKSVFKRARQIIRSVCVRVPSQSALSCTSRSRLLISPRGVHRPPAPRRLERIPASRLLPPTLRLSKLSPSVHTDHWRCRRLFFMFVLFLFVVLTSWASAVEKALRSRSCKQSEKLKKAAGFGAERGSLNIGASQSSFRFSRFGHAGISTQKHSRALIL